jgi:hypothetical protein
VTCPVCKGILGLLEQAVAHGLRFSPEQRRVMLARAEKSIQENTEILAARGYTQNAAGRWGFHKEVH